MSERRDRVRSTSSAPGCSAPRSASPPAGPGSRCGSPTPTTSTSARPAGSARASWLPADGRRAADRRRRPARPHRRVGRRGARARGSRHRRGQREEPAASSRSPTTSTRTCWPATSAATRWPAASGPVRWPRPRRCSTADRGRSRRTCTPRPTRSHLVEALARLCGAEPVRLTPVEHDRAVARTSHLPHLLAVLTAGQLAEAQPEHLSLSGQGVRDVTRIAAGDPDMWTPDPPGQPRGGGRDPARRADRPRPARRRAGERRPGDARGDPHPRGRPAPAPSPASTADRRWRRRRCSSRCPTIPASWPGCSPMWARSGSTSRTSTSTTTRVVRSVWSSWWCGTPPPSRCGEALEAREWLTHR